VAREFADGSEALRIRQEIDRRQLTLDRKRKAIEAQIELLRTQLETEDQETKQLIEQERAKLAKWEDDLRYMEKSRTAPDLVQGIGRNISKGLGGQK